MVFKGRRRRRARRAVVVLSMLSLIGVVSLLSACAPAPETREVRTPAAALSSSGPTVTPSGPTASPLVTTPAGPATPAATKAPSAVGTTFVAGRFSYEPGAVAWAQWSKVAAANMSRPPVLSGYDWALLPLTIVDTSDEPATPGQFIVTLHAAGWAVSARQAAGGVVRMPSELRTSQLEPGQSLSGNLGFWLPARAASDPACWVEVEAWGSAGHAPETHRFACAP